MKTRLEKEIDRVFFKGEHHSNKLSHVELKNIAEHFYGFALKDIMIQWKGDNLKEVVEFTGASPQFNKWFKSWEEYEAYVHSHNDIFKMFYEDGSHYEVPVGAWIVKTPDGYNVASRAVFVRNPEEFVGVRQSPSETFPRINEFIEGSSYRR